MSSQLRHAIRHIKQGTYANNNVISGATHIRRILPSTTAASLRSFHFSSPSATPSSSSSSPSSSSSSHLSSSLLSFFRRVSLLLPVEWLAAPKGWERFFPKGGSDTGRRRTSETGDKKDEDKANDGKKEDDPLAGFRMKSKESGKKKQSNSSGEEWPQPSWIQIFLFGLGTAFIFSAFTFNADGEEITYSDFKSRYLEQNLVDKLEVDPTAKKVKVFLKKAHASVSENNANEPQTLSLSSSPSPAASSSALLNSNQSTGEVLHFYIGSVESFERALQDTQRDMGLQPHDFVSVRYTNSNPSHWPSILLQIAFYGIILYMGRNLLSSMSGGMGGMGKGGKNNPFSFGKSTAHLIKPGESKVTFKDVAGLDDAKVEVLEFVKFLQSPERFKRLGAKIPKGALLCGPPGTGKTLLAKAVAGEAGVPFYSISGSEFQELFVGVGPSRVRDLFAEARKNTPSIIFIDEIDAVGRARSKGGFSGGSNDERENTLNQLLVEMDGMGTTEGVVVLGSTNRKDMLDKALLRPGRFDRHILIDKPDMKGRAQIFMVHLKGLTIDPKHTMDDLAQRLAALTPGFAGADIRNLCNEAALIAARHDKAAIELIDFEKASDRVIGGVEKASSPMSKEEKVLVAHHEAGHAVAAWFLEHADPLLKVTIVPRSNGALGFAQYLPKELSLYHQAQLSDIMAMALGGRAAEQIFFGRVSTGASDDLQKVTRIAQAQVTTYGMSARLGNVSYAQGQDDNQFVKPFSEATAQAIDEEVRSLINATYDRVLNLLEKHRAQVKALADKLIEMENVNHDVLVDILGPRPFASDAYNTWRKQAKEAAEELKKQEAERKAAAEAAAAAKQQGETPEFTPA